MKLIENWHRTILELWIKKRDRYRSSSRLFRSFGVSRGGATVHCQRMDSSCTNGHWAVAVMSFAGGLPTAAYASKFQILPEYLWPTALSCSSCSLADVVFEARRGGSRRTPARRAPRQLATTRPQTVHICHRPRQTTPPSPRILTAARPLSRRGHAQSASSVESVL